MEKNINKRASTIGMFDRFRGIGMILVVLVHTLVIDVPKLIENKALLPILVVYIIFISSLMPAFFMASGYGFRAQKNELLVKKVLPNMFKPYLITAFLVAILNPLIHYSCFHYMKGALSETIKVVLGFLLALPKNMQIGDNIIYCCGAIWYLIAMVLGWILLNTIMYYCPQKFQLAAVIAVVVIGWLMGYTGYFIWCLPQGFVATGYLYFGYQIKKKKLMQQDWNLKYYAAIVISVILLILGMIIAGKNDNFAEFDWALGIISIVVDGVLGFVLLYLILGINSYHNKFFIILGTIGQNSLYIFCIHTIEMIVIPWYLIEDVIPNSVLQVLVKFVLRVVIIFIGCKVIKGYKKLIKSIRR